MRPIVAALVALVALPAAAAAYHPGPADLHRVRRQAHHLEQAAAHVHWQAERQAHHFDWAEERAFRALHALHEEARHFHRQVERPFFLQSPYHTERDFARVVDGYFVAVSLLDALHGSRHVRADLSRVGRLVADIDRFYGFLDRYSHARWGHDFYDDGRSYGRSGWGHGPRCRHGHGLSHGSGHHGWGRPGYDWTWRDGTGHRDRYSRRDGYRGDRYRGDERRRSEGRRSYEDDDDHDDDDDRAWRSRGRADDDEDHRGRGDAWRTRPD